MKPLSCPSSFVTIKDGQEQFPGEWFALVFENLLVATIYQEPHFWTRLRTEGQELFALIFSSLSHCNPQPTI